MPARGGVKLGPVATADAVGAILVHSTRAGGHALAKGRVLAADDVAALLAAGIAEITCARLEPDDIGEDPAAATIAAALAGRGVRVDPARTGRANVRAAADGLAVIDAAAIARGNAVDEAVTIATVPVDHPVRAGEIVATVKVIPFAVPGAAVAAAEAALAPAAGTRPAMEVAAWRPRRVGLVLTRVAGTPEAVLDRAAATQRTRLVRLGCELVAERRVAHEVGAVAAAIDELAGLGCDPILALGASAIMDRRDVIPTALERAGGRVIRFGMPVDPGNLLLLGERGAATFIGVPGCARSLTRSGFDWVLERTIAGLGLAAPAIAALGVGGLLDETGRPTPRDPAPAADRRIAAIVLAAGRGSRMGANKLVAELDGEPLIRHAVRAALAAPVDPVIVVTGSEAARVRQALADLPVTFVHNPDFATGMASSLRAGIAAVGAAAGCVVCLGDMPKVTAAHIARLCAELAAADDDGVIVVPMCDRKRGNPVLWGRRRFAEIEALSGDVGARALIERHPEAVRTVAIDDPAILVDVDTPEALSRLRSG